MKKYVLDLKVVSVEALSDKHVLIKLDRRETLCPKSCLDNS